MPTPPLPVRGIPSDENRCHVPHIPRQSPHIRLSSACRNTKAVWTPAVVPDSLVFRCLCRSLPSATTFDQHPEILAVSICHVFILTQIRPSPSMSALSARRISINLIESSRVPYLWYTIKFASLCGFMGNQTTGFILRSLLVGKCTVYIQLHLVPPISVSLGLGNRCVSRSSPAVFNQEFSIQIMDIISAMFFGYQ
jgi:hypothetical protein